MEGELTGFVPVTKDDAIERFVGASGGVGVGSLESSVPPAKRSWSDGLILSSNDFGEHEVMKNRVVMITRVTFTIVL